MERIVIKAEDGVFASRLSEVLETSAREAIDRGDTFKIGLSGGSLVKLLAACLPGISTDWTKWRFFFCDERIVPFNDKDSTYGDYRSNLNEKVPITDDQFIKIDPNLLAEEAAADYIRKMLLHFEPDITPRFDVLLLGLGPDGHTCSLFPGHKVLDEMNLWVCPITDSPKPPPSRITLTLPVVNNARKCIFPISGAGKADIVKKILVDKEDLPATRVQPANGTLYWILDQGAAKLL